MHLTHHAEARRAQRRLPVHILSAICDYGSTRHSRGAVSLTLDAGSIALAAEDDRGRRVELERYRGAFVIVGEGDCVITAARRTRRFQD